ncbi:hypothetical protein EVAR_66083_1 [Eumeta japonica]|uniref:Uncharacterized protein n=1 Tax=Eumeta variegata TaxID=151549 RepID=A0A4C2A0C6_EUMVA|nr:hypothetical protein EVAR_66083_1 [Eumeta japonica]
MTFYLYDQLDRSREASRSGPPRPRRRRARGGRVADRVPLKLLPDKSIIRKGHTSTGYRLRRGRAGGRLTRGVFDYPPAREQSPRPQSRVNYIVQQLGPYNFHGPPSEYRKGRGRARVCAPAAARTSSLAAARPSPRPPSILLTRNFRDSTRADAGYVPPLFIREVSERPSRRPLARSCGRYNSYSDHIPNFIFKVFLKPFQYVIRPYRINFVGVVNRHRVTVEIETNEIN